MWGQTLRMGVDLKKSELETIQLHLTTLQEMRDAADRRAFDTVARINQHKRLRKLGADLLAEMGDSTFAVLGEGRVSHQLGYVYRAPPFGFLKSSLLRALCLCVCVCAGVRMTARVAWERRLEHLQERLQRVEGNAMLLAAALTFHGPLSQERRTQLLHDCAAACQRSDIPHDSTFGSRYGRVYTAIG